ncbi:hypothetical protein EAI_11597, partial [Harpegnathos saltator]
DTISCQICLKSGHSAQNCLLYRNRPNIICQNCQRPGHSSGECRSNSSNINTLICRNCNKMGYIARNCYIN